MVDTTTALIGAFAAAEVTGVTNVLGGESDTGAGGGSGSGSGGGGIDLGQLEGLFPDPGGSGFDQLPFDSDVIGLITQNADELGQIKNAVNENAQDTKQLAQRLTNGAGSGSGFDLSQLVNAAPERGGSGRSGSSSDLTGSNDSFDLQDLAGTGPAGTTLATGAEAAKSTGDAGKAAIDTLARTGNTLAQSARAVQGKEYTADGTLAEPILGEGTRQYEQGVVDSIPTPKESAQAIKDTTVGGALDDAGGEIIDVANPTKRANFEKDLGNQIKQSTPDVPEIDVPDAPKIKPPKLKVPKVF
jgi:hypothetical protein